MNKRFSKEQYLDEYKICKVVFQDIFDNENFSFIIYNLPVNYCYDKPLKRQLLSRNTVKYLKKQEKSKLF